MQLESYCCNSVNLVKATHEQPTFTQFPFVRRFFGCHTISFDCHEQARHMVIGNSTISITLDEILDFIFCQGKMIDCVFNYRENVYHVCFL